MRKEERENGGKGEMEQKERKEERKERRREPANQPPYEARQTRPPTLAFNQSYLQQKTEIRQQCARTAKFCWLTSPSHPVWNSLPSVRNPGQPAAVSLLCPAASPECLAPSKRAVCETGDRHRPLLGRLQMYSSVQFEMFLRRLRCRCRDERLSLL